MFVRPEQHRLGVQLNARLFANLADHRLDQVFALVNTARRNLRTRFGVIPVVEYEEPVIPLDVDNNSLPQRHPMIVSAWHGIVGCASVRE